MEEDKRVPIDRGWAWVILVANFIVVFLVIGCTSSFGLFFAEFMSEYKASASSITVALSVQTVIFSFSSLFALNFGTGLASSRTYIILGGLFGCSAYVISAIIKDMSYLILSHGVIFGIAYGFSYGPALVVLSRYFNKKRGMAATLGNMGASFGSLIFPPVIRILLDNYGLKGALVIIGGLLLNLCVAGALMRPVAFYKERISGNKVNSKDILSNQKVWTTNNYEFVGLDNLSSAMAINMMMQGLGLSISNPILGYLRDTSGSFYASFYVMGSTLIISGVILFLEPLCRKLEKRRTDSKNIEQGVVITP
ncbi:monocarboxylate transporter 12-like isoform X2 [Saccostrea echinata]|uniref:monocarboxylate transporter 12-like isoform X2 n=1 Tax=Saccostrea echinata TaxID=191078 RepID=UPI002A7F2B85|nr:monocarboxylate transporter 12-like isoform X2 [Saccostrea echinata]